MNDQANDPPRQIRLMNEYGAAPFPLWDDEGLMGGDELELSDALRTELASFAAQWDASIADEVTDDRWDEAPVIRSLVSARYALRRVLNRRAGREAKAEDTVMRALGEELRDRLQRELGDDYRVSYHH